MFIIILYVLTIVLYTDCKCSLYQKIYIDKKYKIEDMGLVKNLTLIKDAFDSKYEPSSRICKKISDTPFDVQDSTGKVRWVSIPHLQLLHPAEHMLTNLPDITSFGHTTKYINHPNLMPNLSIAIKLKSAHVWCN